MTSEVMNLQDDIFEGEVAGVEDYADQTGFTLIPEGNYKFKINKYSVDRDKDGFIRNPKAPTFVLEEIEIVEGELTGRKAFFLRVRSNSYERQPGVKASELGDLMRAIDQTFDWENRITLAEEQIAKASQQGVAIKARLRWSAFDSAHWNGNDGSQLDKAEQKALGKECRLSGMKNFPKDSKGNAVPEWVGPSGETISARVEVAQYYPSR
jgi:hypothetical protein